MKPGRLLIVTYSYSPDASPRAYRWSAIAEYWVAHGHEVHVVCAGDGAGSGAEERQGVHVHRVGGRSLGRLRRWISSCPRDQRGPEPSQGVLRRDAITVSLGRRLARWIKDRVWKPLRWPDYAAFWIPVAVLNCERLLRGTALQYDALITSSHPFSGHIVGLAIKMRRPNLPWLVDIGDPFCFLQETPCNNHRLYARLNVGIERQVFERSDAISVTNEATQRIYQNLFTAAADRMTVIPPLARPALPPSQHGRVASENGRIRLVFVGRLYSGIRAPRQLLEAFRRLLASPLGDRLELHFYGWATDCESSFEPYAGLLGERLFLHGPLDHETARLVVAQATVLVNIGNTTAYQLPSKLVEYVSTGLPILNIAGSENDSSVQFLKDYPAALSIFPGDGENEAAQTERLLWFLTRLPRVDAASLRRYTEPFKIQSIVQQYERLIEHAQSRLQSAVHRPAAPHKAVAYRAGPAGGKGHLSSAEKQTTC